MKILLSVFVVALFSVQNSTAQTAGEAMFQVYCASCHLTPMAENIPPMAVLQKMNPQQVFNSLESGKMQLQAEALNLSQKRDVAEFVTGKPMPKIVTIDESKNQCGKALVLNVNSEKPSWNGWGANGENHRFQKNETKITAKNVGSLKLKWAYGFANADHAQSQPLVIDGALYISNQAGQVQALDAKTGCRYWSYQGDAALRNAMVLATGIIAGQIPRPMIFFADAEANVYGIDAETGKEYWKINIGNHAVASATGSPLYHNGRLYVVLAGMPEEISASNPEYECCTFRGSVTAIDINNGGVLWQKFTLPAAQPIGKNQIGTQLYGPAGISIWSAPTLDVKRNLLYVGTGNSFSAPASERSDAVLAMDLNDGKILWSKQFTKDVWLLGCESDSYKTNKNCPENIGPDMDISASPVLVTTQDDKDLVLVTQKSGMGYAIDPDKEGELVWTFKWGEGSGAGGVYGLAADEMNVYFAVADLIAAMPGGLKAVDYSTGELVWAAPPQEKVCDMAKPTCNSSQSAAVTVIPGVVFSGSMDGGIRAYDTSSGEVLWAYNTNIDFETINGIEAQGGSISGPGQVVVNGMLYVTSGNGGIFGRAGNVLLAFEVLD